MPKIWQNLKNINDWLSDSPTWIQEMLAHLKIWRITGCTWRVPNYTKLTLYLKICFEQMSIFFVVLGIVMQMQKLVSYYILRWEKSIFCWKKSWQILLNLVASKYMGHSASKLTQYPTSFCLCFWSRQYFLGGRQGRAILNFFVFFRARTSRGIPIRTYQDSNFAMWETHVDSRFPSFDNS